MLTSRADRRRREGSAMTSQTEYSTNKSGEADEPPVADAGGINLVYLRGVLASPPGPSPSADTDTMWALQVPAGAGKRGGDRFDCRVANPEIVASCSDWAVGAVVEVQGSLRRRFFRAGGATVSKVEIAVTSATLVEAAPATVEPPAPAPGRAD